VEADSPGGPVARALRRRGLPAINERLTVNKNDSQHTLVAFHQIRAVAAEAAAVAAEAAAVGIKFPSPGANLDIQRRSRNRGACLRTVREGALSDLQRDAEDSTPSHGSAVRFRDGCQQLRASGETLHA